MKIRYSVVFHNGDYQTYTVNEPNGCTVETLTNWLTGEMISSPVIKLGTTILVVQYIRSIQVYEAES